MATSDAELLNDPRAAAELGADENAQWCAGCTRCCVTVCIEVDAPRAPWEYDQWIWVLHHENLELYVERPERWYLHIATRCRQLDESGRCRIHGRHPVLCREYDPRHCERRAPLSDVVAWFHDAGEFERWLAAKRPAHWRRLLAHRAASPAARVAAPAAALAALVTIGEPAGGAAAHEPATHLPPPARRGRGEARRKP
ncbi:MAG: YkgJ family cysteine cluster protein [Candidatus Eisenbacteria bacterium]|nr:YkgJ family cysteine cluster protein [Candidatus Eisenbacteria bacterium]